MCLASGDVVHQRDVTASSTTCPTCKQLVDVFATSEPRPYCFRIARHDTPA